MRIKGALLFIITCCLQSMVVHLKAETITYDFSSTEYWFTTSQGNTHPKEGEALGNIYYKNTVFCFVGKSNKDKNVYFSSDGSSGLMINPGASLKLPHNNDWIINRVIIHSHKSASTSVKVNIYSSHSGTTIASTDLTWSDKDRDYVYEIKESFKVKGSSLYIRASNSSNARIASITIDYTSSGGSSGDSSTDIIVPIPTFNPGSTTFSTESLDVTISAAEGCEVYYTTDGTTPSYTDAETFVGTKGKAVTIAANDSKVNLQAIAVDPTTGKCSEVSSATYTYVPIVNDGTKANPYTVAEVAAMKVDQETEEYWVRGAIYGTMLASGKIEEVTTSASDFVESNMVIGDEEVRIPIQLLKGDIRNEINLKGHPYLQGKEILIKGKLESYCGSMGVKSPSAYQITYTIPINIYGYATLFLDMPVAVPEGCTAYYCTTDGNTANLLPVKTIIPAEIGVVITYTRGAKCSFTYTTVANNKDDFENNQLIGYTQDTDITDSDNTYYALNVKDGQVGFYIPQTENGDGSFTAKAGKAYLKVPAESQVKEFLFSRGNEETIVAPITTHYSDEVIYDLQGRVVSSPTAGVYIKAGRKIIIK